MIKVASKMLADTFMYLTPTSDRNNKVVGMINLTQGLEVGIRQVLAWALRGQLDCDPIFTQIMAESGEEITIHCEGVLECRYILLSRFIVRARFSVIRLRNSGTSCSPAKKIG